MKQISAATALIVFVFFAGFGGIAMAQVCCSREINIVAPPYSAKGDAVWGLAGCTLVTTTVVSCTGNAFQQGDVGKIISIDDEGAAITTGTGATLYAPLVTTITGVDTSGRAILAAAAANTTLLTKITSLSTVATGKGYKFGSTQIVARIALGRCGDERAPRGVWARYACRLVTVFVVAEAPHRPRAIRATVMLSGGKLGLRSEIVPVAHRD